MKTIDEIRLENARILQAEAGGQKVMIEALGKNQSQVSQLMGSNPIKPIGKSIAREIEAAFNKPKGWLDAPHSPDKEDGKSARERVKEIADGFTDEERDEMLVELANRVAHRQ